MRTYASGDRRSVNPILLTIVCLFVGVTGFLAGALPLSAVEPNRLFVGCGPAVFGRPSPLPDPACATAYAPLPQVTLALFVVAAACAIAGITLLLRQRRHA